MAIDLKTFVTKVEDLGAVNTRLCDLFERSPAKGADEFTLKEHYIQILKGSMVDYINCEAKVKSLRKEKSEFVKGKNVSSKEYISEIERLIAYVQDKGMRDLYFEDEFFNLQGGSNYDHKERMKAITRDAESQIGNLNSIIKEYRYFDDQISAVLSDMVRCVDVINESPIAADRVKKIFELRYKLAEHQ